MLTTSERRKITEFLRDNLVLEAKHVWGCYGSPGYIKLTLSMRPDDGGFAEPIIISETTFDLPDKE